MVAMQFPQVYVGADASSAPSREATSVYGVYR